MSDPTVIVLRPYDFGDSAAAMVYGATRVAADCGHEAWIGPTGRDLVQEKNLLTVCTDCMPQGPIEVRTTERMHDELAVHIGDEMSEILLTAVQELGRRGVAKGFLETLQERREEERG